MKQLQALLLTLAVAATAIGGWMHRYQEARVLDTLSTNTVQLISGDQPLGTGVFVDERTIITNAHVGCIAVPTTRAIDIHDVQWEVEIPAAYCSPRYDIAILTTYWPNHTAEPLEIVEAEIGDKVYSLGYGAQLWSFKSGWVGQTTPDLVNGWAADNQRFGLNINQGDSGSPVLNTHGQLVGLVEETSIIAITNNWREIFIPLTNAGSGSTGSQIQTFLDDYREPYNGPF